MDDDGNYICMDLNDLEAVDYDDEDLDVYGPNDGPAEIARGEQRRRRQRRAQNRAQNRARNSQQQQQGRSGGTGDHSPPRPLPNTEALDQISSSDSSYSDSESDQDSNSGPYHPGSLSTIYSASGTSVHSLLTPKELQEVKKVDLSSSSSSSSSDGEGKTGGKMAKKKGLPFPAASTPSNSTPSASWAKVAASALVSSSSSSRVGNLTVGSASTKSSASSASEVKQQPKFIDPYEHQESLQAQDISLLDPENRDIIYTQTMEIVSDTEEEEEKIQQQPSTSTAAAAGAASSQAQASPVVPRLRGGGARNSTATSVTISKVNHSLPAPADPTPDFEVLLGRLPLADVAASRAYLRQHLLLRRADIRQREALVRSMEAVLKKHGLPCQLFIFGSTKNGLGLRTSSDIDIFIQVKKVVGGGNGGGNGGAGGKRGGRGASTEVPIDESHLTFGSVQRVLEATDRILSDDQSYLEELVAGEEGATSGAKARITMRTICHRHMRVPLTRMKIFLQHRHLPSGGALSTSTSLLTSTLQCDLNANNALGIANTRLLRFLCKLEPRFHLLNVLLRYWSKHEAGLNRPDALSSYALSNLLLYFFQARKPAPLLPPIDYLVQRSPAAQRKVLNDWRCDFCRDLGVLNWQSANRETAGQLLVAFFRFYARFDFTTVKISTRMGRLWRLRTAGGGGGQQGQQEFRGRGGGGGRNRGGGAHHRLPPVHIMDPFEQNHNLTARMPYQMYEKMRREFGRAGDKYAKYNL